ncbi:MAG: TlpA disulfide reductase family protein [Woeseiaceae bacterium]
MKILKTRAMILILTAVLAGLPAVVTTAEDVRLAPSFNIPNISGGRAISLDQFQGNVIYVDFWASWCGPCLKSFPYMEGLHQKYSGKGLVIIAINMDQSPQDAHDFLKDHPVTFLVGKNPAGDVAEQYEVMAMPTSYIVDRAGLIQEVHYGFKSSDTEKIAALIEKLL